MYGTLICLVRTESCHFNDNYTVKKNSAALDAYPDPAGSISGYIWIQIFQIYLDIYPDISGIVLAFFNGYYHYKKHKNYTVSNFFYHPNMSGFVSGYIRMAIHRKEIRLYPLSAVQSGWSWFFIRIFFYSVWKDSHYGENVKLCYWWKTACVRTRV